jgi:hypothetical protein
VILNILHQKLVAKISWWFTRKKRKQILLKDDEREEILAKINSTVGSTIPSDAANTIQELKNLSVSFATAGGIDDIVSITSEETYNRYTFTNSVTKAIITFKSGVKTEIPCDVDEYKKLLDFTDEIK